MKQNQSAFTAFPGSVTDREKPDKFLSKWLIMAKFSEWSLTVLFNDIFSAGRGRVLTLGSSKYDRCHYDPGSLICTLIGLRSAPVTEHWLWSKYLDIFGVYRACIVIYFYSKTNEMHQFLKFIYFVVALYMFRTIFPFIIRSLRLYIQNQVYVKQILLSAC